MEVPNRDLLLEWCRCFHMVVANTFYLQPDDRLASYHEPHAGPGDDVTVQKFSMLDFLLLDSNEQH